MNKYLIVIEETETGCSAYSPDLPGCVAAGRTREEVERRMKEAVDFHLEGFVLRARRCRNPEHKRLTAK